LAGNEIAQLGADQGGVAAGMLLADEVIPQEVMGIVLPAQQIQVQPADLAGLGRHPLQRGQGLARAAEFVGPLGGWAAGQGEPLALVEFAQGDLGAGQGEAAVGRAPVQALANLPRQAEAAGGRVGGGQLLEVSDQFGAEGSSADKDRFIHAREGTGAAAGCLA
jgi:hypothetical protein